MMRKYAKKKVIENLQISAKAGKSLQKCANLVKFAETCRGGTLTRCRIEKKEENGENTNQKAPEAFPFIPDWKCSKKMQ